jgi:flavin-dependent dehydrogenase
MDMIPTEQSVAEPAASARIVARADVVVVGGGPAGMAAAIAAARNGAKVTLLERYNHLGGLASGGMVLVLDDMWDSHRREISVRGICMTLIERLAQRKLATFPREHEWGALPESYRRWARWGAFDFHSHDKPHPVCFAAAFDPDGWKRVALEMVEEMGIDLRLHSWFSRTLSRTDRQGRRVRDQAGREAILGDVVDRRDGRPRRRRVGRRAARQGQLHHDDRVPPRRRRHRCGRALRVREPAAFAAIDKEAKKRIGGSWRTGG